MEIEFVAFHPCRFNELCAEGKIDMDAAVCHESLAVLRGEVVAIDRFPGEWAVELCGNDLVFRKCGRRI